MWALTVDQVTHAVWKMNDDVSCKFRCYVFGRFNTHCNLRSMFEVKKVAHYLFSLENNFTFVPFVLDSKCPYFRKQREGGEAVKL